MIIVIYVIINVCIRLLMIIDIVHKNVVNKVKNIY